MDRDLAGMDAHLALGAAPPVANQPPACADDPFGVLDQYLLDCLDSSRQAQAFEGTVDILPSRFEAGGQPKARCRA